MTIFRPDNPAEIVKAADGRVDRDPLGKIVGVGSEFEGASLILGLPSFQLDAFAMRSQFPEGGVHYGADALPCKPDDSSDFVKSHWLGLPRQSCPH
jgi:hypothetical protein